MIRYAQSNECRMSSLVRHFGDTTDSRKPCGICDFCAPENCVAQKFRAANKVEDGVAREFLMHSAAAASLSGNCTPSCAPRTDSIGTISKK